MSARLLKTLFAALLCYAVFTAQATGISISTRVENISYDLGFMQLSLENIGSSMRLSPTAEGSLLVEDIRARRLLITMIPDAPSTGSGSGLPEHIGLPLAIRVKTASVAEVVIIDGESRQTLNDVVLHLQADDKQLQLELLHASTPWGQLQGDLSMQNARPFTLDGKLNLKQPDSSHPYDLQLDLAGNLQRLQFSGTALLQQIDNQQAGKQTVLLRPESDIATDAVLGRIAIDGQLGLEDGLPLELRTRLSEFGPYPGAKLDHRLNADIHVQGTLAPQSDLNLRLETFDSHWRNVPIGLRASARLQGQAVEDISLDASLQDNRLQANGSLGLPSSTLAWQVAFSDLAAFDPTLRGHFSANGKLRGPFDRLAADMQWLGENLGKGASLSIERLSGQATLEQTRNAAFNLSMRVDHLSLNQSAALNTDLKLSGTPHQHRIELDSRTATSQQPLLQALMTGTLSDNKLWTAQLEKLRLQGARPVEMQGKAGMQYDSSQGFSLEKLALLVGGGQLQVDRLQVGNGRLATRGRLDKVNLAALPEILPALPAHMTGNPVFSGSWDITADETANGRADIRLISGDIGIEANDGNIHQLGLDAVDAKLELTRNQIRIDAQGSGKALGELHVSLATELEPTASGFVLNRQAPLAIDADARLQSLLWLPFPHSIAGAEMDGRIDLQLTGKGTIAHPELQGRLQGRKLRLAMLAGSVDLQNGTLDAAFRGDQLDISQARFTGGDGFITAAGNLSLRNGEPQLTLQWHAEDFTAVSRTDSVLVIAGDLDTHLSGQWMEVGGNIEITRGLIELGDENKPVLGDDVVVIGVTEEAAAHPLQIQVNNLRISTGNQFVLRGRGLDSTLTGGISLNGRAGGNLRAEGMISAAGTYMAYGQVLNIERGRLTFNGQIDNPGLDLLALRQNLAVRAGVEIRGTALSPVVKLVSVPEVSDSDKLAWLVFGHGMDRVGQDQFAMLSLAAGALLSQGQSVPLQTRFARAAGLDSFNVGGTDAESASVSLGKRLAPSLYLSYEKEITGLLNVARLTYDLTSNWSVRTQAGSESAVDVLYTFSFK